jgi:hypothetical protein
VYSSQICVGFLPHCSPYVLHFPFSLRIEHPGRVAIVFIVRFLHLFHSSALFF